MKFQFEFTRRVLVALLLICGLAHAETKLAGSYDSGDQRRLDELLTSVPCIRDFVDTATIFQKERLRIPSGDIELAATLYSPQTPGVYPAVVFMHGGGNNYQLLMSGPRYYAARLASCGFVALVYDKRGTGESGGLLQNATFDDFITDAGAAAMFLAGHDWVDRKKIAVYGGSEGGRLAPVTAARFPVISAVISISGPIGSLADQATHNMNYALRVRGYADSLVDRVMPLWKRHHAAWANNDTLEFKALASEVTRLRESLDPFLIPSTHDEILTDSNLYFLRPMFNSMSRDYTEELKELSIPHLVMLGELDKIINVRESFDYLRKRSETAGEECEIFVIKDADHSFFDKTTGRQLPVVNIFINWLRETWSIP